jgi:hypothetical protein
MGSVAIGTSANATQTGAVTIGLNSAATGANSPVRHLGCNPGSSRCRKHNSQHPISHLRLRRRGRPQPPWRGTNLTTNASNGDPFRIKGADRPRSPRESPIALLPLAQSAYCLIRVARGLGRPREGGRPTTGIIGRDVAFQTKSVRWTPRVPTSLIRPSVVPGPVCITLLPWASSKM